MDGRMNGRMDACAMVTWVELEGMTKEDRLEDVAAQPVYEHRQ